MKTYTVVFAPEAQDNLVDLYEYIAKHGSPAVALRYTKAIVTYCDGLSSFPHRGTRRDDVRPGLRVTHYRGRAVIAFEVNDATEQVSILGIFYGGRDFERSLGKVDEEEGSREPK